MSFFASLIFSLGLGALGAAFLVQHVRKWRGVRQRDDLSEEDRRYHRSQFFRRTQTSSIMLLLAVAVFVGANFIAPERYPQLYVYFWLGTLLLVGWMAVLAVGDLWLVRRYAARHRTQLTRDRRELERQLRELNRSRRNSRTRVSGNGSNGQAGAKG